MLMLKLQLNLIIGLLLPLDLSHLQTTDINQMPAMPIKFLRRAEFLKIKSFILTSTIALMICSTCDLELFSTNQLQKEHQVIMFMMDAKLIINERKSQLTISSIFLKENQPLLVEKRLRVMQIQKFSFILLIMELQEMFRCQIMKNICMLTNFIKLLNTCIKIKCIRR